MARGRKVMKKRAEAKKFAFKYEGVKLPEGVVGKYYPAEDVVKPKGPVPVRNPPKLRASITPGTVLILVAGRFRGKRVVFLKQLTSGLLLVTGPYEVNGVPLRRVNQKYVIATRTNVSVAGVKVNKIDDAFFAREKAAKKSSEEVLEEAAAGGAKKETVISAERKAAQTAVDKALIAEIAKVDMLKAYLSAKFTLSNSDKPHALQF